MTVKYICNRCGKELEIKDIFNIYFFSNKKPMVSCNLCEKCYLELLKDILKEKLKNGKTSIDIKWLI